MENNVKYPIRAVARRTGLSAHVIRAWEKRYQAVVPQRTETNRRVYSEEDIERLRLLKRATEVGHSISQVATKPIEELRKLAADDTAATGGVEKALTRDSAEAVRFHIDSALEAVSRLDGEELDFCLRRASVALSQPVLLEEMIVPLMEEIGRFWADGTMRVAHEHLATAVVRNFLGSLASTYSHPETAPAIVIGTPAGQEHELGAVLGSMTALAQGWRVVYVGANLPATELALAVRESGAQAIGLSVVYPPDDPRLEKELRSLHLLVSDDVRIVVGGRSSGSYSNVLRELGIMQVKSLTELRKALTEMREVG